MLGVQFGSSSDPIHPRDLRLLRLRTLRITMLGTYEFRCKLFRRCTLQYIRDVDYRPINDHKTTVVYRAHLDSQSVISTIFEQRIFTMHTSRSLLTLALSCFAA